MFKIGSKFEYIDEYGSRHECEVVDRQEITDKENNLLRAKISYSEYTMAGKRIKEAEVLLDDGSSYYGHEYICFKQRNGMSQHVYINGVCAKFWSDDW